jgi:phosphate transport system substrate-binding protein
MKPAVALVSAALLLAACAAPAPVADQQFKGWGPREPRTDMPDINPLQFRGSIVTAGSSTVFPLSQRVAEMFKDEGFKGQITVDSIGTGAGFERFCKGETDVSNASARITQKQTDDCKSRNITPLEFRVGTDALAVVMDNESTFVNELTVAQLAGIFSGTYKTWDQLNPAYPAERIQIFSPGTDSGTFDYFVEAVFKKDKKPLLDNNPQLSEDDNVLVRGVEGSKYAIGYFGYAFYNAENKRLKAIRINGVAPNRENIDNAKYPLARPLFLYSTEKTLREKPQVAAFVGFYLARVNDAFRRVAYFPAPEAEAAKAKALWRSVIGAP